MSTSVNSVLQQEFNRVGLPPGMVTGLAEHTAEVEPGFVFMACTNDFNQLREHVAAAYARGAAAIVLDESAPSDVLENSVPLVLVPALAERRGQLAADFYAHPSETVSCLGVTGTNGKTSTAFYIADLLDRLGEHSGYCGTLGVGTIDTLSYAEQAMTTPNAVALQRILSDFKDQQIRWCALEISSHALDQERASAVKLRAGVFTNLSRDHLDYHQTMQAYADAKARLFTDFDLDVAVVNVADTFGNALVNVIDQYNSARTITYGDGGQWSWQRKSRDQVRWSTPVGEFDVRVNLLADYQLANLTGAIAVLYGCGFDAAELYATVPDLSVVPGRLERLSASGSTPGVVVDFAHTPDALTKVLGSLQPVCAGRLYCVVGCGGDRDRGKRPEMAQAAIGGADRVWLTSDNPRSEDPSAIIEDMIRGISQPEQTKCVIKVERAEAIRDAISSAEEDDLVLIAGKGDERYQEINGVKHPFDDREVARGVLNQLGGRV